MGLIFRKRIKILPGIHINLGKSGVSTSIGRRGASVNIGKRGTYFNTGLPGTGMYYRKKLIETKTNNNLIESEMYKQTYGLPAILSFFVPGLGQLLKGQILKGVGIWIIGGVLTYLLWWTIVVPFVIWIWNIYDAYNSNPN